MSRRERHYRMLLTQAIGGAIIAIIFVAMVPEQLVGLDLLVTFGAVWIVSAWAIDDVIYLAVRILRMAQRRKEKQRHVKVSNRYYF